MDIKRTDRLTEAVDAVDGIVIFVDDSVVEDDDDGEDEWDDECAAIVAKKENGTRKVNRSLLKRLTDVEPGAHSIVAQDWPR